MPGGDFRLSAQLAGHEADVRALSFPSSSLILSASRDCSVRTWRRSQTNPPIFEGSLLSRGSEYVNALAFFPPTKEFPDGLAISGGKDTIIEVKSPSKLLNDNAERLMVGHAHNVCTIDVCPAAPYMVSGGWDGQARVWNLDKWETEHMLGGHGGVAVWGVLAFDEKTVVTACADKSIRIFDLTRASSGELAPRSTIYTQDIVRALCKVPSNHPSGADLASASNDGVIRLWKFNGQQIAELHGHESFIYSLAALPSGELVSSGEDRTVRIWRGNESVQTITHPAISVWAVAVNSDTGDIVTGSSDGFARVFTRRVDQVADAQTLKEFENSIKSSSIPQQQVGGVNKEKLPGPEFLTNKSGTKEGQVQMVREADGAVSAHVWSMSKHQWENVGTVVDAVGSTGKKVEYNGKMYDYVFDVDIEDGKPPLKLPYNLSENPYERATKFLSDNELPVSYLDNVANFITQNTQGAVLGAQNGNTGPDPYGTESRYKPGEAIPQQPKVIPQTEYLSISAAKYEGIFNKILTVNKTMISAGRKDSALNPGEVSILQQLQAALESSKPLPSKSLDLIIRIASQWPYTDRLAGLDLLRCVARYHTAAQIVSPQGSLLELAINSSLPSDETLNENAIMMGLRVVTNVFATAEGRSLAASQIDGVLTFMERVTGMKGGDAIGKFNRNLLIALTTACLNYAVLISKEKLFAPTQRRRLITVLSTILNEQSDSEVLYRGLIALGTVLKEGIEVASSINVKGAISKASNAVAEERVRQVSQECSALIQ